MPNGDAPVECPAVEYPVLTKLRDGIPELIDTAPALKLATEALGSSSQPVALDTERAQGFRYGTGAWLVQIRRDDVGTFLIDSHALPDLSELAEVLQTTWILHAAEQDLPCLTDLGMDAPTLFDTETAARLAGSRHFSLRGICEEFLGLTLEKAHQHENWSVRPLPTDWLRYAAMDVEVLPQLEEILRSCLEKLDRLEWANQEFEYQRTHPLQAKENRWENLKGLGKVRQPSQLAVAKELWEAREEIAIELDLAPTRVLSNRAIIDAALADPQSRRGLQSLGEFRRPRPRQYMDSWWEAMRRAHGLTLAEMPRLNNGHDGSVPPLRHWRRLKPNAVARLQAMRALVETAAKPFNLEADVVLEPRIQRELIWTPVRTRSVLHERLEASEARLWQRELIARAMAASPGMVSALGKGD